ncbi:hypothetical protein FF1_046791 [Malus domestica]
MNPRKNVRSTTMEVKDEVNALTPTNTKLQHCEAPLLIAASVNNVWRSTTPEEACPSSQLRFLCSRIHGRVRNIEEASPSPQLD